MAVKLTHSPRVVIFSILAVVVLAVPITIHLINEKKIDSNNSSSIDANKSATVATWDASKAGISGKNQSIVSGTGVYGGAGYATNVSVHDLLASTNKQREDNGLPPLVLNDQLNSSAIAKAKDMASKDYWSHNAPDGTEPWTFIKQVGYQYKRAGENLAYGYDSSSGVIYGWMNSPEHRANVLGDYVDVGFGIANSSNFQGGPTTIVVAHYGKP